MKLSRWAQAGALGVIVTLFLASCPSSATAPRCGDAELDTNEQCDDGNSVDGDGCSAECAIETAACGNGRLDSGEGCDDGNVVSGDGCSMICLRESSTICGNGTVEGAELCDDGNMSNADACLNSCIPARCGDGNLRTGVEECDSGSANSDVTPNACRLACRLAKCGDRVSDSGETCDDGNLVSGDGCSMTCTREPLCGDTVLDPGEDCDDGNVVAGDGCSPTCVKEQGCGDSIRDPSETCDDGNMVAGDGCSATCQAEAGHTWELEPNDVFTVATPVTLGTPMHGSIAPASTDGDWYAITLTARSDLRLETTDGMGAGSCVGVDTKIELKGTDGVTSILTDYDDGVDRCSLMDPATDTAVRGLRAGTYYARVSLDLGSTTIPHYRLHATLAGRCGDSIKTAWEECDDGNLINGDHCDDLCRVEPDLEVEPNSTPATATSKPGGNVLFRGAITPIGDEDYYQITLPLRSDLTIETFDEGGPGVGTAAGTCAAIDTKLQLYASDGTTLLAEDDEAGINSCAKIASATYPGAKGLSPGIYYVKVTEFLNDATIPQYHVKVTTTAACGDGVLQTGEQCDDSNGVSGDGCSSICQFEAFAESEPNDDGAVSTGGGNAGNDFSTANANGVYTADRLIAAALTAAGDEDVFAIRNTTSAPVSVQIQTYGSAYNVCETTVNTFLNIRDAAGTVVASDDNAGLNSCSLVSYSIPAMTTIYAHVVDNNDDTEVTKYHLQINFP